MPQQNEAITRQMLEEFLKEVDHDFPVPLSEKVDLSLYAQKLLKNATLCAEIKDRKVIGLVAGYTENLPGKTAYIALVGVLRQERGRRIAQRLVLRFAEICREKKIAGVHLYTSDRNTAAKRMYETLGFTRLHLSDEPRPKDVHYILNLTNQHNEVTTLL